MKRIWNFFSSLWLTIALAALICVVSAWGSLIVIANQRFFRSLDQTVLIDGLAASSRHGAKPVLWIYILVVLVALFAINTFVCTADKVYSIIRERRPWKSIFPHIVHAGFLVALIGHLLGSTMGFKSSGNVLYQGEPAPVPNVAGLTMRLDSFDMKISDTGEPESISTKLTLLRGDKTVESKVIGINHPLVYGGVAFYHEDQGEMPSGVVLEYGGERKGAKFGEEIRFSDGTAVKLGEIIPDYAIDAGGAPYSRTSEFRNPYLELTGSSGAKGYMSLMSPGAVASTNGKTFKLADFVTSPYVVLTINKDPGIGFIIAGSIILTLGMALLLFLRGGRSELVRTDSKPTAGS